MTTRATYVMRNGRLVRKDRASPAKSNGRIHVISDDLGADLEHHGYSDGRRTASKSVFRRWTKEAGLVEKGNDRVSSQRNFGPDRHEIVREVATAVQMLKEGYRPGSR